MKCFELDPGLQNHQVAPRAGAGIEIAWIILFLIFGFVAPRAGAGIEMHSLRLRLIAVLSPPARGRELK